jgi:hypothetical protein
MNTGGVIFSGANPCSLYLCLKKANKGPLPSGLKTKRNRIPIGFFYDSIYFQFFLLAAGNKTLFKLNVQVN